MKFIILAAVVAVATAAKLTGNELGAPVIAILRDDRVAPQGGAYQQEVETENGIYQQESGQPGSFGQSNTQGAFSYVADDGSQIQLTYIADENGFQPQGRHLPTPPPLPEHVYELLRIAEEQRAAGITFEK